MNAVRKWIRNLFGFSGREVNGFMILLPLMVIMIASEPLYRLWRTHRTEDLSAEQRRLDSLVALWDVEKKDTSHTSQFIRKSQAQLFFRFDPNKTGMTELQQLGFPKFLATRIVNYRQKGGQFRVKSDLLKIYRMDSSLYHRLYAYIQLPEQLTTTTTPAAIRADAKPTKRVIHFDLNNADSSVLESVYGIGPALASRIIRFREGLGGFVRMEQLKEVYGLDSATVRELSAQAFIAEDFIPRKLDVNHADERALAAHPYIRKFIARAIVAYRFQHGLFSNTGELSKITVLKPEEVKRIIPYLKVND